MFRVVLDTNIIVSALWSNNIGNPTTILSMALDEKVALFVTQQIIKEYENVLFRDKFRHKFSLEIAKKILFLIEKSAIKLNPPTSFFPYFPDETDRKFYDLAKAADAYLITGNIKHFPQDSKIITPADFLKMV